MIQMEFFTYVIRWKPETLRSQTRKGMYENLDIALISYYFQKTNRYKNFAKLVYVSTLYVWCSCFALTCGTKHFILNTLVEHETYFQTSKIHSNTMLYYFPSSVIKFLLLERKFVFTILRLGAQKDGSIAPFIAQKSWSYCKQIKLGTFRGFKKITNCGKCLVYHKFLLWLLVVI